MSDILQQQWACLTCNAKFPVGEIIIPAGHLACDPWPCPHCGNPTLAVADGSIRETTEYYGEMGTKNQDATTMDKVKFLKRVLLVVDIGIYLSLVWLGWQLHSAFQ